MNQFSTCSELYSLQTTNCQFSRCDVNGHLVVIANNSLYVLYLCCRLFYQFQYIAHVCRVLIKIYLHRVSKNVPPLVCYKFYNFDTEMLPIKQAIKRRFTMPPQLTCASAPLGKTGNTKIAFFTRCISALLEFNQSLLDFFNLFDSQVTTHPHAAL